MSNQKDSQQRGKYRVPALEKGLEILETLASTPVPQSLADLARTLNRSSSELFRMLNYLERCTYVVRDDVSGNYQLSLKLYTLAHTHPPIEHLLKIAHEPMQTLAQSVRESCHLSVLSHGNLVVLAEAESPRRVRLSVRVGREFSAIHTASGRTLLAHLPAKQLEAFLMNDPDYQALSKTQQKDLRAGLTQIQKQGYLIAKDETHVGIRDMSVPVGKVDIGLLAALTVPSLQVVNRPGDDASLLAALQDCAKTINKAIGVT